MSEPTPAPTIDAKTTPEYAEGRQAFLDGRPNDDNPYPKKSTDNNERTRWFVGWYDAKYELWNARFDAKRRASVELRKGR